MKEVIDRLVLNHGISVVAVTQELGDFEYWNSNIQVNSRANDKSLKFECEARKPGKGAIKTQHFCNKFSFDEKGRMIWGKRTLIPE